MLRLMNASKQYVWDEFRGEFNRIIEVHLRISSNFKMSLQGTVGITYSNMLSLIQFHNVKSNTFIVSSLNKCYCSITRSNYYSRIFKSCCSEQLCSIENHAMFGASLFYLICFIKFVSSIFQNPQYVITAPCRH